MKDIVFQNITSGPNCIPQQYIGDPKTLSAFQLINMTPFILTVHLDGMNDFHIAPFDREAFLTESMTNFTGTISVDTLAQVNGLTGAVSVIILRVFGLNETFIDFSEGKAANYLSFLANNSLVAQELSSLNTINDALPVIDIEGAYSNGGASVQKLRFQDNGYFLLTNIDSAGNLINVIENINGILGVENPLLRFMNQLVTIAEDGTFTALNGSSIVLNAQQIPVGAGFLKFFESAGLYIMDPSTNLHGVAMAWRDSGGTVHIGASQNFDGSTSIGVITTSSGVSVPGNQRIFSGTIDPATIAGQAVSNGDLWFKDGAHVFVRRAGAWVTVI